MTSRSKLPTGTVTFLFTDIEGSTKLLNQLGAEAYSAALADHRRLLRRAFSDHGGVEVDTQGDAFFVAFAEAGEALAAAAEAQQELASGPIRIRMGLHTGTPHLGPEGYVGQDVHLGARIAAAGHGGQVLLSKQTRELVDGELSDLGEHRLKDFATPVWIYQLGADRFPPLRTISNTNLPRPASSFVGREQEVGDIGALLRDRARLVTLTGPGGSGKTRLALEAAAELVPDFRNGVFWVDLAPLRDAALVAETIAQALGAKDGLAEHIGERQMLLVLDNLEQVVESAPELAELVEACPNLRLLDTSRELLRVRGEVEYPVPPLATPEAIELFVARSGLPPTDTIAELCRRLDNLPLAVELAAARTSVLSPPQILDRLAKRLDLFKGGRDTDPRQQTLRATIEWSHELLDGAEQSLFARLSVFVGGCTLEAAEEVAEADLDLLQSLVDKSLLRHADDRFTMLETIREFAAERLDASGESDELRRRHAEHFLALAEEAEPRLLGTNPEEWLTRMERELDNLRGAHDRMQASGETQLALRLTGAVWMFWNMRGHLVEGRRRLESALRADERPTQARAKALNAAGDLATWTGDHVTARLRAEEALAHHRMFGDVRGTAHSLWLLGFAVAELGDLERARQHLDESVRAFREVGDEHAALGAIRTLAWLHRELGDRDHARALNEDGLERARALGDPEMEATLLGDLATQSVDEGRVQDALAMLRQSARLWRELGDRLGKMVDICRLAGALAVAGRPSTAVQLLSGAEALRAELGAAFESWNAAMNEKTLAAIRVQLDEEAFARAWEEGKKLTADEAVALALAEIG